jgi:hypothetical protein
MRDRIEDAAAVTRNSIPQELHPEPHAPRGVLGITDKAELSLTAQARLLKERGANVEEIASQLGLTIAIVEGTLGVPHDTPPGELLTK